MTKELTLYQKPAEKLQQVYDPEIDVPGLTLADDRGGYDLSGFYPVANQPEPTSVVYDDLDGIEFQEEYIGQQQMPVAEPVDTSFTSVLWASMVTENSAVSKWVERETEGILYEPGYDPDDDPQTVGYERYREIWGTSGSPEQTRRIMANVKREEEARQIIESAPLVSNFIGVAIASTLDPVYAPLMLMPFTRAFKEASLAARAMTTTGVAGVNEALAETAKHQTQDMRTVEESLINVAMVTGFTAFLGAGVTALSVDKRAGLMKKLQKSMDDPEAEMNPRPDIDDPDNIREVPRSASAAEVRDARTNDAEMYRTAGGFGLEKISTALFPLTRMSESRNLGVQKAAAWLGLSGAYLVGDFTPGAVLRPNEFGPVAPMAAQIAREFEGKTMTIINEAFSNYRGIKNQNRNIMGTRIADSGRKILKQEQPLKTYDDFNDEIFWANERIKEVVELKGVEHWTIDEIAVDGISREAADAATRLNREVMKPILDKLVDAEIFDKDIYDSAMSVAFWSRNWDRIAVRNNRPELVRILSEGLQAMIGRQERLRNTLMAERERTKRQIDDASKQVTKELEETKNVRAEAHRIKDILRNDINTNDPQAVRRYLNLEKPPKRLNSFIISKGGLQMNSELAARDISGRRRVGLISEKGLGDDGLREAVYDAGYYHHYNNYDEIPLDEIWDDIAKDLSGNARYDSEVMLELQNLEYWKENTLPEYWMMGLDSTSKLEDIEAAIWVQRERPALTKDRLRATRDTLREANIAENRLIKRINQITEDIEMTPQMVRNVADLMVDRIANTPNGIPQFPASEFGEAAKALAERTLAFIPNRDVADFINKHAASNSLAYIRNIAPEIALNKHFPKDPNFEALFEPMAREFKKDIYEIDASDLPEKKKSKEKLKAGRAYDKGRQDAQNVIKSIRGQLGVPEDPDSYWVQTAQFMKAWNVTRLLGFMTPASIPDLARTTGVYGFRPVANVIHQMFSQPELKEASLAELKAMGVATEVLLNTRAHSYAGMDQNVTAANQFQRGIAQGVDTFATLTGINAWNDMLKGFTGIMTQHYRIDSILAWADGKATKKQIMELKKAGIDERHIEGMARELRTNGNIGELNYSNVDLWADRELAQAYKSSIHYTVDQIVLTPNVSNQTFAQQTVLGGVVLQFKSFSIAAQQSILLSNVQARDAAVAQGIAISMMLAATLHVTRGLIKGESLEDLTDPGELYLNALDRSGLMGVTFEATGMLDKISGGALNPLRLFGDAEIERQKARGVIGQALGPSFGLAEDAIKFGGALTRGEFTPGEASSGWRLLPTGNLWYIPQAIQTVTGARE